jgi:hypothetical protein
MESVGSPVGLDVTTYDVTFANGTSFPPSSINTLRTGDANLRFLRFCITTVKHEWRKSAFLTRAWFPCTSLHNTWSISPNGPPGRMFKETWPHSELMIYDKYRGKKIPVLNVLRRKFPALCQLRGKKTCEKIRYDAVLSGQDLGVVSTKEKKVKGILLLYPEDTRDEFLQTTRTCPQRY